MEKAKLKGEQSDFAAIIDMSKDRLYREHRQSSTSTMPAPFVYNVNHLVAEVQSYLAGARPSSSAYRRRSFEDLRAVRDSEVAYYHNRIEPLKNAVIADIVAARAVWIATGVIEADPLPSVTAVPIVADDADDEVMPASALFHAPMPLVASSASPLLNVTATSTASYINGDDMEDEKEARFPNGMDV